MTKQLIQDGEHWAIGNRRCWWYDCDDDWLCRISLDKANGRLTVQAGNAGRDGEEGMVSEDCTLWQCEGYDLHALAAFFEFIVGVVGDADRMRQAFGHLIRVQYSDAELFKAGSVCCNVGAVLHRWEWSNVPAVETVSVDEIGK